MFFNEPKTLIVVYKDELLVNQLKKLVETKDDFDDEKITGTRDGSVRIVAWTEKVWCVQKTAGNINNKVLFIGDIKDADKLVPIIDVKFDEFGIKYGWAGNQAVIISDIKALSKKDAYNEFVEKFMEYGVPERLKAVVRPIKNNDEPEFKEKKVNKGRIFDRVGAVLKKTAKSVSNFAQSAAEEILVNRDKLRQQMYFYGIMKLYDKHLEAFMRH